MSGTEVDYTKLRQHPELLATLRELARKADEAAAQIRERADAEQDKGARRYLEGAADAWGSIGNALSEILPADIKADPENE